MFVDRRRIGYTLTILPPMLCSCAKKSKCLLPMWMNSEVRWLTLPNVLLLLHVDIMRTEVGGVMKEISIAMILRHLMWMS